MRRTVSALCGLLLIAIAFIAAAQVADTREGLIAEVITLLAGLAGVGLLLYGLVPKRKPAPGHEPPVKARPRTSRRSANDLLAGGAGLLIAVVLLTGLAVSAGWTWTAMGAVLLVPMIVGSVYMVVAFARAPERDWSLDLKKLFRTGD